MNSTHPRHTLDGLNPSAAAPLDGHAPSVADLTEGRLHAIRTQGHHVASSATAAMFATLPYEAAPTPLQRHRVRTMARLALAVCASTLVWWGATTDGAIAAPTCYEDMPCFVWSTMGGLDRGVVLTGAPARCTGRGYQGRICTTIVDAAQYCYLRREGGIDRLRTRSLKGDMIARDHGCDARYFAQ